MESISVSGVMNSDDATGIVIDESAQCGRLRRAYTERSVNSFTAGTQAAGDDSRGPGFSKTATPPVLPFAMCRTRPILRACGGALPFVTHRGMPLPPADPPFVSA